MNSTVRDLPGRAPDLGKSRIPIAPYDETAKDIKHRPNRSTDVARAPEFLRSWLEALASAPGASSSVAATSAPWSIREIDVDQPRVSIPDDEMVQRTLCVAASTAMLDSMATYDGRRQSDTMVTYPLAVSNVPVTRSACSARACSNDKVETAAIAHGMSTESGGLEVRNLRLETHHIQSPISTLDAEHARSSKFREIEPEVLAVGARAIGDQSSAGKQVTNPPAVERPLLTDAKLSHLNNERRTSPVQEPWSDETNSVPEFGDTTMTRGPETRAAKAEADISGSETRDRGANSTSAGNDRQADGFVMRSDKTLVGDVSGTSCSAIEASTPMAIRTVIFDAVAELQAQTIQSTAGAAPEATTGGSPLRTLQLKVNSDVFGAVHVRLSMLDGKLHLSIITQSSTATQDLQADRPALLHGLEAAGYLVSEVVVKTNIDVTQTKEAMATTAQLQGKETTQGFPSGGQFSGDRPARRRLLEQRSENKTFGALSDQSQITVQRQGRYV
jgi:hypothetical protein